jgi:predicted MFS family arabinose efflux permease
MTSGQAVLAVLDPQTFHAFSIAAICLMLGLLPMTLTRRAQPKLPPESRVRMMDLVRLSPVGLGACVASGALTGATFGLFPFYAAGLGLDTGRIALFMSAVVAGGLVLNWPLGKLSDRMDRRWIIAAAGIGIAASSVLLALSGGHLIVLIAAGSLLGGATSILYSIGAAHTNDNASGVDSVAVGAGLLLAFGTGAIAGPPVASALMDVLVPNALFGFTGAIGLALAVLAITRIFVRDPVTADEKIDFINQSGAAASPIAADVVQAQSATEEQLAAAEGNAPPFPGLPEADVERSTSAIAQSA